MPGDHLVAAALVILPGRRLQFGVSLGLPRLPFGRQCVVLPECQPVDLSRIIQSDDGAVPVGVGEGETFVVSPAFAFFGEASPA